MSPFALAAILMTFVGLAGWLNVRTLHIPRGVAMLIAGLVAAVLVASAQAFLPQFGLAKQIVEAVNQIDFVSTVTGYMLAFLLFAGAMQVDIQEMQRTRLSVAALATLGVVGSIVIVGGGLYFAASLLGARLSLLWALVFGALISPTDPVAVLATVRHVHLSKRLTAVLQGEALFNDGVGIVAFTALLTVATGSSDLSFGHVLGSVANVLIEAIGGLGLGIVMSRAVTWLMERLDDFVVETTLSIALAMGSYALAQSLHLSGAIAVVGAGMMFSDPRAKKAMRGETELYLTGFWNLADEILNAVLFLLLGIELLAVRFMPHQASILLFAIPLVVGARFIVVQPWAVFYKYRRQEASAGVILGWGGLRGALSLALALTLPAVPERTLLLSMTYLVVAFSIVMQGLTFAPLVRRFHRAKN